MSVDRHIEDITFTAPTAEEIFGRSKISEIELGLLQMQILWILNRQSTHGYEIMKMLSELKNTKITQGTLYPTMQRLESLGYVKRREEERKIMYDITAEGKTTLDNACASFTRTFFGIFHDYVCGKCVTRDLVNIGGKK
ncbi:MAG: PadR family transcriptional regulator [Candidatus Aenigmarchaeota archaeon]|nr:PadR family transcriptional regulator [Candidatus Aenigmarchaeota archaeon]